MQFPRARQLFTRREITGDDQLPQPVRQQPVQRPILRRVEFEFIPLHCIHLQLFISVLNLNMFLCEYYDSNQHQYQQANTDFHLFHIK